MLQYIFLSCGVVVVLLVTPPLCLRYCRPEEEEDKLFELDSIEQQIIV